MTVSDTGSDDEGAGRTLRERRRAPEATRAPPSRALVLVPVLKKSRSDEAVHSPENRLLEARGLADAIELDIVDTLLVSVATPRPATLFGWLECPTGGVNCSGPPFLGKLQLIYNQ